MKGRVLRVSGLYARVELDGQSLDCALRGKLKAGNRRSTSRLVAGDWVEVKRTSAGEGVVESLYPRQSKLSRAASGARPIEQVVAANIDRLFIVASVRQPALRLGFVDRALVIAQVGGIEPVLCLNKVDLDREGTTRAAAGLYGDLGYKVVRLSAKTGLGIDELTQLMAGRVSALLGQSGVGKSSLLNCVDPNLRLKTQGIMARHDRGRHTTTAAQLFGLAGGGYVADTPGIKTLQLWQMPANELIYRFCEMAPLADGCRFRDCAHGSEPDCGVRQGVEAGKIAPSRYQSYRHILEGLEA